MWFPVGSTDVAKTLDKAGMF